MRERCANCGTTQMPAATTVTDWRTDYLCDRCVASFDWSGWTFDPIANTYTFEREF